MPLVSSNIQNDKTLLTKSAGSNENQLHRVLWGKFEEKRFSADFSAKNVKLHPFLVVTVHLDRIMFSAN